MKLLFSIKNIICFEIVVLILIACYFALKGYQLQMPTASIYAQCYQGEYHSTSNMNASQKIDKREKLSK